MRKWEKILRALRQLIKEKKTKPQDQQCSYHSLRISKNDIDFNNVLRPKTTYLKRFLKGLTVVHVLWVRCTEEILIGCSQEVKTTKKTLLANQRILAKGLEQYSINIKNFSTL